MKKAINKKALNKRDIKFLQGVFEVVESNLENSLFGVEELCKTMAISRSHLHRRLNKLTGLSASSLIRQIRLAHAKSLLLEGEYASSEVAYKVGFSSQTYFTKCFHDHFGYPPGLLLKNKEESELKFASDESLIEKIINLPEEKRWLEDVWEVETSAWKTKIPYVATLSGFVFIILISFYLIHTMFNLQNNEQLEKSIAVLPFRNDTGDEKALYFAKGMTEEIVNSLAKSPDIIMPGKATLEQFIETTKSIPELADKLNVTFILEGSVEKFGEEINISLQLLNTLKDEHIWTEAIEYSYDDQFKIISEITVKVISTMEGTASGQNNEKIRTIPSYNIMAYDLFLQARDKHDRYENQRDIRDLNEAVDLYKEVLGLDSSFARAYSGLALACIHKQRTNNEVNLLDSAYKLANIALRFDDQLDEAHYIRGFFFTQNQINYEKALSEFDRALTLNPNYFEANKRKAWIYFVIKKDFIKGLEQLYQSVIFNKDEELTETLRELSRVYQAVGVFNKADFYAEEAFKLDKDTLSYYVYKAGLEELNGDFEKELAWAIKAYQKDSTSAKSNLALGKAYLNIREWEKAIHYCDVWSAITGNTKYDPQNAMPTGIVHDYGHALHQVKGEDHSYPFFQWYIEELNPTMKLKHRFLYPFINYDLAGIYAFLGDEEKAFYYLSESEKKEVPTLQLVNSLKRNPLFDTIRDKEKFKLYLRNIEMKYQAEHNRVKEWLEKGSLK
jgi:TolB-like protein/AraC-like DNA-binding protein